jgi:hypothetical protein
MVLGMLGCGLVSILTTWGKSALLDDSPRLLQLISLEFPLLVFVSSFFIRDVSFALDVFDLAGDLLLRCVMASFNGPFCLFTRMMSTWDDLLAPWSSLLTRIVSTTVPGRGGWSGIRYTGINNEFVRIARLAWNLNMHIIKSFLPLALQA